MGLQIGFTWPSIVQESTTHPNGTSNADGVITVPITIGGVANVNQNTWMSVLMALETMLGAFQAIHNSAHQVAPAIQQAGQAIQAIAPQVQEQVRQQGPVTPTGGTSLRAIQRQQAEQAPPPAPEPVPVTAPVPTAEEEPSAAEEDFEQL